jgi:hypothetical protein
VVATSPKGGAKVNKANGKDRVTRRDLFKKVGFTVGAAATVSLATTQAAEAEPAKPRKSGAGYRETEHVRTYYELAKF